jgi:hypothetical protein
MSDALLQFIIVIALGGFCFAANIAKLPEMLRQNTNPANRTRTTD